MLIKKRGGKVLQLSIKKLSIGIASVLIGVGPFIGSTEIVEAQSNFSSRFTQVGGREFSRNIFQENFDYTKNYNSSDLQFNPSILNGDTLKSNTIGFEVYGKINITTSIANFEVRFQLDEKLVKYVKKTIEKIIRLTIKVKNNCQKLILRLERLIVKFLLLSAMLIFLGTLGLLGYKESKKMS